MLAIYVLGPQGGGGTAPTDFTAKFIGILCTHGVSQQTNFGGMSLLVWFPKPAEGLSSRVHSQDVPKESANIVPEDLVIDHTTIHS